MEDWNIKSLLGWITDYLTKKGIESPRLSAELLLCHVLKLKRIELYTNFDQSVAKLQLDNLHELVKRAGKNEPIAYLTGRTTFYSLEFSVTPDCLIPRPESELLVERAVEFLRGRTDKQRSVATALERRRLVCDLCTGSGCIAIAIAKNTPDTNIIATDISDSALQVAMQNAEKHEVAERIKFFHGDLFEPLIPQLDKCQFDLIVCNPPYVTSGEYETLESTVKEYEPPTALRGGVDGLDVYRKICAKVEKFLKPDSMLMFEIGYAQGPAVVKLLGETGLFEDICVEKDLQDNDRIVIAKRLNRNQ